MIKLLALLVLSPLAYSAEFQSFKKCIETNIIELTQTDEFKSSNFIRYDGSQDDLDVKSWLENDLFPGWDPSKKNDIRLSR
jgi:hypothetical protein